MEYGIIIILAMIGIAGNFFLQSLFLERKIIGKKEKIVNDCRAYYEECLLDVPVMTDNLIQLSEMIAGTLHPEETEAYLLLEQMDRVKKQLSGDDCMLVAFLSQQYEYCRAHEWEMRCRLTIPTAFQKDYADCLLLYDSLLQIAYAWLGSAKGGIIIREAEKFGLWHLQMKVSYETSGLIAESTSHKSKLPLWDDNQKRLKWIMRRYHMKCRRKKTANQLEIDIIT